MQRGSMCFLGCFPPKWGCCNRLVCFSGGAGATSSGSLSLRLISDSDTEMCPKSGVGLSKMASFMLSSFWVRSDSSFFLLRLFSFCCSVFFLEGDEVLAEIIRMFYE